MLGEGHGTGVLGLVTIWDVALLSLSPPSVPEGGRLAFITVVLLLFLSCMTGAGHYTF